MSIGIVLDNGYVAWGDMMSVQYAAAGGREAVLRAYASAQRNTMAEVSTHAYGLTLKPVAVPIYAQSGDQRVVNVQKMILKRVDILLHGLINSPEKFGCKGEVFKEFAQCVAVQVKHVNDAAYKPILHFDLYGNVGHAFDADPVRMASFNAEVAEAVSPYKLHIEAPADFGSTEAQIEGFLKRRIQARSATLVNRAKMMFYHGLNPMGEKSEATK